MKQRIDYLKNFGFADEVTIVAPGINAKMNELQAAYGFLRLKYVDAAIEMRHQVAIRYREVLKGIEGISYMEDIHHIIHNYFYFPIFVDESKYGMSRDVLYQKMKDKRVMGHRYFYPLISEFSTYKGLDSARIENLSVAHKIASQVICLPMHHELNQTDLEEF